MKYLTLLLLFSVCLAYGQSITITGKVVDKQTGEPLSYATVGLKDQAIGTISNQDGEFDFHIPESYSNETFSVNMLGYRSFEAPVSSLIGQEQTIALERSTMLLEEVTVTDSLNGGDILRTALARINNNYPNHPFILDGFYRDVKKVGGRYISLLEAAVKIYDENYAEPRNKDKLHESVRLVEVRQSLGYESKFTSYFDQDNLLEDLLVNNNIRYRQFDMTDEFFNNIVRQKDSYYNGHDVFVLSYAGEDDLKFYIDKADFSILRMEYSTHEIGALVGRKKHLDSKLEGMDKVIEFKRYQGEMYLNYMTLTTKLNWYDERTNELKFSTELYQQLLINNINPAPQERITSTEKMRNYGLQFQNEPYNKNFWDNYNFIKETPLDKKILADLERAGPLEEQFEKN